MNFIKEPEKNGKTKTPMATIIVAIPREKLMK